MRIDTTKTEGFDGRLSDHARRIIEEATLDGDICRIDKLAVVLQIPRNRLDRILRELNIFDLVRVRLGDNRVYGEQKRQAEHKAGVDKRTEEYLSNDNEDLW